MKDIDAIKFLLPKKKGCFDNSPQDKWGDMYKKHDEFKCDIFNQAIDSCASSLAGRVVGMEEIVKVLYGARKDKWEAEPTCVKTAYRNEATALTKEYIILRRAQPKG